jgi:hypothetical protein
MNQNSIMKQFTREFLLANHGCYTEAKLLELLGNRKSVKASTIIKSSIPLKDKYWFFCYNVFSPKENKQIAIAAAEAVLPLFEEKYPEDLRPRKAIEAAKGYLEGHISLEELQAARRAATDAAYAYAAYAYTAAADAAYAAAAYAVADADAAAAYYADAAAADAAASSKQYTAKLEQILIDFINENK